jgi:BirA family biotin operon repressor/biotin-[acetyl-CoA-carboxylase] ligase
VSYDARVTELARQLCPELPLPVVLESTPSTNDEARQLALQGAPHGTAVLAHTQRAGRGRLGRSWISPPGHNVCLSVVLRPTLPVERVPLLCLAAAVAVARVCGPAFRIKWPNDVVDSSLRKVAGILAEAEWASGAPRFVVLGIGVNVESAPADLPACSLALHGDLRPRERVAVETWRQTLQQIELVSTDPEQLLQSWRARSATLGAQIAVGGLVGRAVSIDGTGALLVDTGQSEPVRVLAGDVAMLS